MEDRARLKTHKNDESCLTDDRALENPSPPNPKGKTAKLSKPGISLPQDLEEVNYEGAFELPSFEN